MKLAYYLFSPPLFIDNKTENQRSNMTCKNLDGTTWKKNPLISDLVSIYILVLWMELRIKT